MRASISEVSARLGSWGDYFVEGEGKPPGFGCSIHAFRNMLLLEMAPRWHREGAAAIRPTVRARCS